MGPTRARPGCSCARTLSLWAGHRGGRPSVPGPAWDPEAAGRRPPGRCPVPRRLLTSKEWDNKAVSLQGGLRGGCVSYRGQDYELQKVELVQANGEVVAVPEDIVKQISGSRN